MIRKSPFQRRAPVFAGLIAVLAVAAPDFARADYLWVEPEGETVQVHAGELHKPLDKLPAYAEPKAVLPEGKSLPIETAADHFSFKPEGDARFTAAQAGADGVLTYYHARFGRASTTAVNDLELVPREAGGNTFQLFFKGRPVAAGGVSVDTSEGWRRTLTPAADGTISFDPSFPGLYVLEVSAKVNNASVEIDGKTYTDVRHTATLSFDVKP